MQLTCCLENINLKIACVILLRVLENFDWQGSNYNCLGINDNNNVMKSSNLLFICYAPVAVVHNLYISIIPGDSLNNFFKVNILI